MGSSQQPLCLWIALIVRKLLYELWICFGWSSYFALILLSLCLCPPFCLSTYFLSATPSHFFLTYCPTLKFIKLSLAKFPVVYSFSLLIHSLNCCTFIFLIHFNMCLSSLILKITWVMSFYSSSTQNRLLITWLEFTSLE